ncbi:MAG: hypothetical protein JSW62_02730 [Thermoplasmatales archaeon]|nr:MAG: hypothetical protein JSW62_02730 [Thermoplasmatales archaeon]
MKLLPNNEIIGRLTKITSEGQQIKLVFSIDKEIEVPVETFSHDQLKKYLGHRIGIFNFEGQIFLRKI